MVSARSRSFMWGAFVLLVLPAGKMSAQQLRLTEPATDSTFPMAVCGDPMEPATGRMNIAGVVGYHLAPDGRPDTASVRVLAIEGMSVAGFRSAVSRRLAGCRMTLPYGYQGATIPVRQEVRFIESGFALEPARRQPALPDGLASVPVSGSNGAEPYPLDDSRVEERPWQLSGCKPQGVPSPPDRRYRTREEAARAYDEWSSRMSGEVILQVTVGADGRVVPGSDSLVLGDNPLITNALIASIKECRFHPARIGGVPVAAKTLGRMGLLGGVLADL